MHGTPNGKNGLTGTAVNVTCGLVLRGTSRKDP